MRAEHLHHFVANDLDDLLAGRKRGEHFVAHGLFFDGLDELFGDAEMHVGLKQCDANFAQRGLHVFRREFAFSTQVFEDPLEFVA